MRAKCRQYLPWGERALTTCFIALLVVGVGASLGFVGDRMSWKLVYYAGSIITVAAFAFCAVFWIIFFPCNLVRVWRSFRDAWNHPPVNRHKDWRP